MERLIPVWTYEYLCKIGSPYEGYVWKPNGMLFKAVMVTKKVVNDRPSGPLRNTIGIQHSTRFIETVRVPGVKLVDIGSKDVVYDDFGNFLYTMDGTGHVKGQIKIQKTKPGPQPVKNVLKSSWDELTLPKPVYDYVDIAETTLSAEVYSKIFTHILTLMDNVDLSELYNGAVTVTVYKGESTVIIDSFNRPLFDEKEYHDPNANAFYSPKFKCVNINVNKENMRIHFNTVYNAMNIAGDHELLGHGFTGWTQNTGSHNLTYLYQMIRPAWENTTDTFKILQNKGLTKIYQEYKSNESDYNVRCKMGNLGKDGLSDLMHEIRERRKGGYLPKNFDNTTDFDKRMKEYLKKWDPYK